MVRIDEIKLSEYEWLHVLSFIVYTFVCKRIIKCAVLNRTLLFIVNWTRQNMKELSKLFIFPVN